MQSQLKGLGGDHLADGNNEMAVRRELTPGITSLQFGKLYNDPNAASSRTSSPASARDAPSTIRAAAANARRTGA